MFRRNSPLWYQDTPTPSETARARARDRGSRQPFRAGGPAPRPSATPAGSVEPRGHPRHPESPVWGSLCYQSSCSAPHPAWGHLLRPPFPVWQGSAEMLILEPGLRCPPRAPPCDPARHSPCWRGSLAALPTAGSALRAGTPGAAQPARPASAARGQGHRAHSACQCQPAPHRTVAGAFISLILTTPSECLSTVSLGRPLYLLINLTDKRLPPYLS